MLLFVRLWLGGVRLGSRERDPILPLQISIYDIIREQKSLVVGEKVLEILYLIAQLTKVNVQFTKNFLIKRDLSFVVYFKANIL